MEDDQLIGDGLKVGLEKLGFAVDWFTDGLEGEEALYQASYAAVVLDLGLPGQDGLEVLKNWRQKSRTEPVLILTARGDVDQRIAGLNSGADDYLGKPFSLKEVQARLNALIRRSSGRPSPLLTYGNVAFDPETRKVTSAGREVVLSPKETALLELLLLNKNKVLSKEAIESKIYYGMTKFRATRWRFTFTICAKNSARTLSARLTKSDIYWKKHEKTKSENSPAAAFYRHFLFDMDLFGVVFVV